MTDFEPTIPCETCNQQTAYLGTKKCNRCWELDSRIHASPYIALKIIMELFDLKTKFAWWPVKLSYFNGKRWVVTNKKAWLKTVQVVETVWGETFYVKGKE